MNTSLLRLLVSAVAALVVAGCGERKGDPSGTGQQGGENIQETPGSEVEAEPLVQEALSPRVRHGAEADTLFVALSPNETGISPVYTRELDAPFPYLYNSGMEASGIAIGDVDGDGLPDVFLASSPGNNRLYRQVAPMKFEDVTAGSGLDSERAWSRGASFVDIDNDGDLDLYVANYAESNALYINKGKGSGGSQIVFEERAKAFGLDLADTSLMPTFCDYDADGDLDLYMLSNLYHLPDKSKQPNAAQMVGELDGKPIIKPPFDKFFRLTEYRKAPSGDGFQVKWDRCGRPNFLFRNNGDGSFSEVTEAVGMKLGHGRGLSATWWDYNDDGHIDLYVANDWGDRDYLYHNNGDGTFRDAIEDAVPATSMFTMGSDAGDLNNDGRIDFIAADMSGTTHYKRKVSMGSMQADKIAFMASARPQQNMRNAVYLNTGTNRLLEGAFLTGLANSDWSWAIKVADLDNDGFNDVFVTNGMEQNLREIEGSAGGESSNELRKENNLAFRNGGDLHFTESGAEWGLDHFGYSTSAANCDFDRDGDLDLLVMHRDEAPLLYENTSTQKALIVRLRGRSSHRDGFGATVRIETSMGSQVRQITAARGYLTSEEPLAHFGLGKDGIVSRVVVDWPSGHRQEFEGLASDQLLTITEPAGDASPATRTPEPTLFAATDALAAARHSERDFDDFASQPLLPNKLSQYGPGIAVGDIDGDGDEDFVLGGGAGSPTQIITNSGGGAFASPRAIADSEAFEDMGALLFDADADGDPDLYVASGGVEARSDEQLHDRLYLNDGEGNFSPAVSGSLPLHADNSGPVAAADIDRDGDLDLFVGGGSIPARYPLAASSHLLINDGKGIFVDAPAPLPSTGIVRGASFSDIDGDGWQDLLLACEWGPVAYLHNDAGTLSDRTEIAGLTTFSGWWNSVAAGDLDADGDIDFVAGNFGHNTKYHASQEKPALLYYGAFGTETMRLVEAEFEGDHLLPVRGKSCSTSAIPHLGDKFKTFHSFALADIQQIYTQPVIDDSTKFAATTLDSGVFINDGEGCFEFHALPELAQIAPVFGISVNDFDGDGLTDLFLAQNFYAPQVETGRMSGGLSLLLRGTGGGAFDSVWPAESGVSIPEDAAGTCLVDLDGDRWPDLVVANNNSALRGFIHRGEELQLGEGYLRVDLRGRPGNPAAIGARVTAKLSDGTERVAEVRAGDGYLSQSPPSLYFSRGGQAKITTLSVRWPQGGKSAHPLVPGDGGVIVLEQP